jgi:hypothetical protein
MEHIDSNDLEVNGPVGIRCPQQWWATVDAVAQAAHLTLTNHITPRADHWTRDMVTASLLRRAAITYRAIAATLYYGLLEPSIVAYRTLLEVELSMKLIVNDDTNVMAERLAVYHYISGVRVTQAMTRDDVTRTALLADQSEFGNVTDRTRRLKHALKSKVFDSVRDDVVRFRHWSGARNIQEAFEWAKASTDFTRAYSPASAWVHATNVDAEWSAGPDGSATLKPFWADQPREIESLLSSSSYRALNVHFAFAHDRKGDIQGELDDVLASGGSPVSAEAILIWELKSTLDATFKRSAT